MPSPTLVRHYDDVANLVAILRLSTGDVLCIAREVAENAALRSVDDLTRAQREQMIRYLGFLAEPVRF